jgi:hypothetical protein
MGKLLFIVTAVRESHERDECPQYLGEEWWITSETEVIRKERQDHSSGIGGIPGGYGKPER